MSKEANQAMTDLNQATSDANQAITDTSYNWHRHESQVTEDDFLAMADVNEASSDAIKSNNRWKPTKNSLPSKQCPTRKQTTKVVNQLTTVANLATT